MGFQPSKSEFSETWSLAFLEGWQWGMMSSSSISRHCFPTTQSWKGTNQQDELLDETLHRFVFCCCHKDLPHAVPAPVWSPPWSSLTTKRQQVCGALLLVHDIIPQTNRQNTMMADHMGPWDLLAYCMDMINLGYAINVFIFNLTRSGFLIRVYHLPFVGTCLCSLDVSSTQCWSVIFAS